MDKQQILDMLPYNISNEKIEEILNLETTPIKGRALDLTGQHFDRLIALKRGPNQVSNGKAKSRWWCICDCEEHNIVLVTLNNLRSGNTKSCGCRNLEQMAKHMQQVGRQAAKDLTQQRFGELIALYPTEERNNHSVVWVCQCSCGRLHKVSAKELLRHNITSCGCKKDSNGIREIKRILELNQINYITEKTFPTCKFSNGASARFDFFIEQDDKNYLIEFDGIQHFEEVDYFSHDTLQNRQEKDKIKNQWCIDNHIPLIRIPYTAVWNLTLKDLQLGSQYQL